MPTAWDARADRDLLLSIIETGALTKIDWAQVSVLIKNKGHEFSAEACRQHYQKLRRASLDETTAGGIGAATSAKPKATPSKRKASATGAANDGGTPSKRSKARGGGLGTSSGASRDDTEPPQEDKDENGHDFGSGTSGGFKGFGTAGNGGRLSLGLKEEKLEADDEDYGGFPGQTAAQFKQEWKRGDPPIDLENDE